VIREVAERAAARRRRQGIGRAALLIGVITVFARLVGFGRQVVFAHTVGTTCLGTAYTTANMVPNIIYDIVLGGALSSVVVPVLAGPAWSAVMGADGQARRIASALLTWTVVLLVPVSAVLALAAHPIVRALLSGAPGCPHAALTGVGARMLIVFAPQVPLYGLAVVLYGILQSHRRFGAPALAPLLSSLVVIGAYAAFGAVGGGYVNRLAELPPRAEYLLSGGTTLGVLALVLTAVIPAWRLGVTARPTLRFPDGVGTRVRRLALAGVVTLVAQDASVAVVIVLANRYGAAGSLVIYGFAWAVFVVPYAVLAVPIATSAFPELSATSARFAATSADAELSAQLQPRPQPPVRPGPAEGAGVTRPGDVAQAEAERAAIRRFDVTAAASTRAAIVASWLGAAVLVGAREPIARVFESRSLVAAGVLALALAAFAPGLIGYGLSANLSRVLYAHRRNRAPALAIAGGWALVILADLLIVPFVPAGRVVPALGLGTTFGLTVSGIALLVLVHRERGPLALHGVPRAFLAGLTGCVAGAAAGSVVAAVAEAGAGTGLLANLAISALVTIVASAVFGGVVLRLDGGDLRTALSRLRPRRSDVEAVSS
jgi:peptidoglycan biosynthesis protein MviN/MurJ (putative lipid II flippase)